MQENSNIFLQSQNIISFHGKGRYKMDCKSESQCLILFLQLLHEKEKDILFDTKEYSYQKPML